MDADEINRLVVELGGENAKLNGVVERLGVVEAACAGARSRQPAAQSYPTERELAISRSEVAGAQKRLDDVQREYDQLRSEINAREQELATRQREFATLAERERALSAALSGKTLPVLGLMAPE